MNPKRAIPSVSLFLTRPDVQTLIQRYSRENTVNTIREVLAHTRTEGKNGGIEALVRETAVRLAAYETPGLKRVVNATGTLIHTNLGRAVLSQKVLATVAERLSGYSNLEYDLETGGRGKRAVHVEAKLNHLAGSEASLVVNNNAAAVMLLVNTFALGKEVVVSRGELVEIGGSFRLPDIIQRSGGILREVGTTNKTRLSDYQKALNKNTGLILKMHTSNYKVTGFTEETPLKELAALAKKARVPLAHDAGSGLFADAAAWGFGNEPDPRDSLKQGASLVTLSGDKLLGGPQAGIVLGKKKTIDLLKKNPMMRALRLGKLPLLALEAALVPLTQANRLAQDVPLFAQLSLSDEILQTRAETLARAIAAANPGLSASVEKASGSVGGGSQPGETIPSYAVVLTHAALPPKRLAERFRGHTMPIIGDFHKGRFCLNVRSLLDGEEAVLVECAGRIR